MARHPEAKGFLIDGFPANLEQANICQEKLGRPQKIIVLDVTDEIMKKRLEDGENFNDQHDTVLRRINTYKETTAPVIEQYAGTIKKVKADRSVEEVYQDVKLIMES